MKPIALALAIFLTPSAFAAESSSDDAVEYFGAPADFLDRAIPISASESSCGAESPADFSKRENTFYAPVSLATGVDPIVRADLFLESGATERVRKKTGKDFAAVLSAVVRLSADAGAVRAVSAYEAASHAKVKSGAEFLAVYRRLVAKEPSGGAG
jgi:hypothetical protein